MATNAAPKTRGRPLSRRDDPTMRYIAKRNLWSAIALQCGISTGAVRMWSRVPPSRVRDVEAAIGRSRALIRPDIYGRKSRQPDTQPA